MTAENIESAIRKQVEMLKKIDALALENAAIIDEIVHVTM
jgi:hypothetical protein